MSDLKIKEGQVWKYDNRAGEDESRAVILKIEECNDGAMVIHIHVTSIRINNPHSDEDIEEITHMPFSVEAAGSSLQELVGETEIPDYQEGYETWKQEYENGNAGIFSISIGESVKFMDDGINS